MSDQNLSSLTMRQKQILIFIRKRTAKGLVPTVREIGAAFNIRSSNGVVCHLKALQAKGYLTKSPHLSRGMRVTDSLDEDRVRWAKDILESFVKSPGKFTNPSDPSFQSVFRESVEIAIDVIKVRMGEAIVDEPVMDETLKHQPGSLKRS